jgi:hypothetical protein
MHAAIDQLVELMRRKRAAKLELSKAIMRIDELLINSEPAELQRMEKVA